ncbi:Maf family nucleotide pyrophosphatase [uncultured Planktosalinus sp.]|uniref:Maf family nucleotide pyrophosphatase n=1 Tax=uncultured Planktosalinus sp. TaxID=1810935 RepID=UPI0030D80AD8
MLKSLLSKYNIILATGSPRRQQFFRELEIPFTLQLKPVNEVFPDHLKGKEIAEYLSMLKASEFTTLKEKDLLITGDTIVVKDEQCLGKPTNTEEAHKMLRLLSDTHHEVISSVCFTTTKNKIIVSDITKVWFKNLSDREINYYIQNYQPFDKAGAYGIQEWIGAVSVTKIEGSYNTVMGLPTHLVYKTLIEFGTQ